MSRRRRRDDGETDGDILSEDEGSNDRGKKLPHPSESDLENDDLDVSDYESLDEERRQSSDEEEQLTNEPPHRTEVKVADNEVKVADNEVKVEDNEVKVEDNEVKVEDNEVKVEDNETKAEDDAKPQRESGDGKEQSDTEPHKDEDDTVQESGKTEDNQKEDDDPAFIPTKGTFFQHDVRSDDQPKGRGRGRKIWDKEPVKWIHDMFVMEEQMPKSRDILISNYGYDIREKPINGPHPPSDARRIRGRGRGGGYRGRGRFQNAQRDQRRAESTNENRDSDSKEEYPALNSATNRDFGLKLKSKSYYKRNTNNQPVDNSVSQKVKDEPESRQQKGLDTSLVEGRKKSPSKLAKTSEKREDEKLSDLLEVINNRENTPSSKEPTSTTSSNSRRGERHPKNYQQSTTFSNYQEAPKPRRYSSLRQRQTNSPVDQQSSRYSPRSRDDRYANFSKPVQPSQTANFTNKSYEFSGGTTPVQNQTTAQEPKYAAPMSQTTAAQTTVIQPHAVGVPQAPATNQQPVVFSDPSIASMGPPLDQSLMQMPLQYNPMLNTMYEAAAYQRMMQMMSQQMLQMNMDQLPTSLPPQMNSVGAAIPPDPQSLPHPSDMQMNPLMPPLSQTLSQGTLGSVMRPPPPHLNPPAYFAGPMGMNMGTPRQSFPYPSNLVAQQFGGVTYFNTPTQSPPIQPDPNQGSPRRNAAIPIMAPTWFGPPGAI